MRYAPAGLLGLLLLSTAFGEPYRELGVAQRVEPLVQEVPADIKKVALVIANGQRYTHSTLPQAPQDGRQMVKTLKSLGFRVLNNGYFELDRAGMIRAIEALQSAVDEDTVVFVYYAGHAFQDGTSNYLQPIDVKRRNEVALARDDSVPLDSIRAAMDGARLKIEVLDACRNNPFFINRAGGAELPGLVSEVVDATGMITLYATQPGRVAPDSGDLAGALSKWLQVPGMTVEEQFKNVQLDVQKRSGLRQFPTYTSSVTGDYYPAGRSQQGPTVAFDWPAFEQMPDGTPEQAAKKRQLALDMLEEDISGEEARKLGEYLASFMDTSPGGITIEPDTPIPDDEIERIAWEQERRLIQERNDQLRRERLKRQRALALESQALEAKADATELWEKIQPILSRGGPEADKVRDLFLKRYADKTVSVTDEEGTHTLKVQIPELIYLWLNTVAIDPGSFEMGCTSEQSGCGHDESPVHTVSISQPYELMATEVTQGLWSEVMGSNPSNFINCGSDCPVEQVSWLDVVAFANALSDMAGLEPCYVLDGESVSWPEGLSCKGYRLPTEAEWEYAARGGESHRYSGSATAGDVGWWIQNSSDRTHAVAGKSANAFGLYDMSGNVREWTWDWYQDGYRGLPGTDPYVPGSDLGRVYRGGSWCDTADRLRVSNRDWGTPGRRNRYLGVRLARSL